MDYVTIDDYQLCVKQITPYETNPDKPVLVFLHDSWGCIEMWRDFPEKLSEISRLNAMVYDRRGYGKSSLFGIKKRTNYYLHDEADILIQLFDKIGIKKAIAYGHSDGATIALIAAARYPEYFEGLILEGAHSFIEDYGLASVVKSREKAKHTNLLKSLERFHGDRTGEVFRLWHETWLDPEFASWNIIPLLSAIKCPVLAFQGKQDEFGTIKQLTILKDSIPAPVIITEISNAQHTPRREAPEETIKWIKDFFKQYF